MSLGEFIPSSNTKLLLHLNGSSVDSSGLGNSGTDTAITYSQANGKFGQGAGFNGSSSKIIVGTGLNTALISNAWTISLWLKPTAVNIFDIFMANDHNSGARQFALSYGEDSGGGEITTGKLSFERAGIPILYDSGVALTTNWNHTVLTYNGTNLISYINGNFNTTTAMSALPTSANSVYLGQRQYPTAERFYTGNMDEVIIENVAWSAEKVKKYYTYAKGRYGIC